MLASRIPMPLYRGLNSLSTPSMAIRGVAISSTPKKGTRYPSGFKVRFPDSPEAEKRIANQIMGSIQRKSTCHKDIATLVETLASPSKTFGLIKKIDTVTKPIVTAVKTQFGRDLSSATAIEHKDNLRRITADLCKYYGYGPMFLETVHGVLDPQTFLNILVHELPLLDLGENGHGPLVHLVHLFMMEEMAREGSINCSKTLYKALGQDSAKFLDPINELVFGVILDGEEGLFNPAAFANAIMDKPDTFPTLAPLFSTTIERLRESHIALTAPASDPRTLETDIYAALSCSRQNMVLRDIEVWSVTTERS